MLHTEDFIQRLEFIMEHFGLSASSFADKINVQRSSISHLLSGRNKPSLDFVMKVLDIFPELNLYWFLDGKGSFLKENGEVETSKIDAIAPPPMHEKIVEETPTLFSEEAKVESGETEISASVKLLAQKSTAKNIEQIVIFYTDGTFDHYNPSSQK